MPDVTRTCAPRGTNRNSRPAHDDTFAELNPATAHDLDISDLQALLRRELERPLPGSPKRSRWRSRRPRLRRQGRRVQPRSERMEVALHQDGARRRPRVGRHRLGAGGAAAADERRRRRQQLTTTTTTTTTTRPWSMPTAW